MTSPESLLVFAHRHMLCLSLVGKHVQSACVCLFVIFPESYSCILSPLTRTHSIHTHKHSLDTRKQGRGPKNTTGDKPFHSPGDCDGVAETSLLQGFLGRYVRYHMPAKGIQQTHDNPKKLLVTTISAIYLPPVSIILFPSPFFLTAFS